MRSKSRQACTAFQGPPPVVAMFRSFKAFSIFLRVEAKVGAFLPEGRDGAGAANLPSGIALHFHLRRHEMSVPSAMRAKPTDPPRYPTSPTCAIPLVRLAASGSLECEWEPAAILHVRFTSLCVGSE